MVSDRSACPSPRTLEQLLAEQLTATERDSVETHVEDCTACQSHLESMLAPKAGNVVLAAGRRDETDLEPAEAFLIRLQQMSPPSSRADGTEPPSSARASAQSTWAAGERLGQYEIIGKLGKGGMGAVYKARHTELGKLVALKMLKSEHLSDLDIARFKNEIRAVGRLDHPNIVVAHDAGESRGVHFLVMEFVDGMDLGRLVDLHGRLHAADACELVRQAAIGLQHAYERGVVHRDVKPSNLMLARDGRVRLLDLGLARSFGEAAADTLTAEGMLLGTPDYLAPEQWDNPHAADVRSDIYSLGCTLYQLLVGRAPFTGERYRSVLSKMRGHLEVAPLVEQARAELPAGLDAVLSRMLAKNPADRFATPAAVAAALRPFTTGCAPAGLLDTVDRKGEAPRLSAPEVATPSPWARETETGRKRMPATRRRHTWVIALACLWVVGIAAAIFGPQLWRSYQPTVTAAPTLEEFRVDHYRGKEAKPFGDLRNTAEQIRISDSVRVFAKLSAPAYCYLIALNPDGSEQLCHPAWEGDRPQEARSVRPEPVSEVRFFPDDKGMFGLDAAGLQVFVLIASTKPLPPYAEWRSQGGAIPWKAVSHGGDWRWEFNGQEFTRLPLERGKRAEREAEPQVLTKLVEFLRGRSELELVRVIAFPVMDEDEVRQLEAKAGDLCRDGKFAEAQEPLRQVVARIAQKKGDTHADTMNATRSVETIKRIAAMSEEARAEFVESYRVYDEMRPLLKKGKYREALPLAKRGWEIRRRVMGPESEAAGVAAYQYGTLLFHSTQYREAEPLFRECLETIRRIVGENHEATSKAHGALAMTLKAQDKYAEAEPHYEAALRITKELLGEDHASTAIAYNNLAGLLERRARFTVAEPFYRTSLDILLRTEGESSERVATARANLAFNLGHQARYAEGEVLYRQALAARRKLFGDDHPDVAMTYSNLAVNLDEQGRHAEAEPLVRKAVDINTRILGEDNSNTAITLNNLGMTLQHQRRYEEAEPLFRKALEVHLRANNGEPNRSAAGVHNNLASNLQARGQLDAAREQLETSVSILRKVLDDEHPDVAQGYNNMASVLNAQKQHVEAEPLLRKGLGLLQKRLGVEHDHTALAQANLANNLHNQGKHAEAESLLRVNLEAYRRILGEGHASTTWAYMNRISNLWALGKYREAEELGPAAVASFEAARPRLSASGLARSARTGELTPMLNYLAAATAINNHAAPAWQYLESRLARGLIDDLAARPLSEAERDKEQTLRRQINRLDEQVASLMRGQPSPPSQAEDGAAAARAEADKLRSLRDLAQAQLADLQVELAAKYGVVAGKIYDLPRIQERLPLDAALVAWVDVSGKPGFQDPNGAHWVCAVRRNGDPVWVRLQGSGPDGAWQTEDEELPANVRSLLADRADASKGAWRGLVQKLYAQRLAPLVPKLGATEKLPPVRQLIILPSTEMAGIPVEALTDRFTISYAPSGTTFAWLQEQRDHAKRQDRGTSLLALGDPTFERPATSDEPTGRQGDGVKADDSPRPVPSSPIPPVPLFDRLPATRIELHAISRLFTRVESLTKSEASEQNLDRLAAAGELAKFRFLHFATHGLLDDKRALNSALILAQDRLPDPLTQVLDGQQPYDGRLTAAEILRGWKLDADLVTLSACETALGKFSGGEGYLGFSQALFIAGARGMVLSLWRVDDRAAALLMTRFYENMLGTPEGGVTTLSKAEALAEAKRWLRGLSAGEVDRLTAALPKGLPAGTRGVRRERPDTEVADGAPRPFEHPYYWSAFILIGDHR